MEEKVIIVLKGDKPYDISDTALIKDYQTQKYIPEIDKLLDWRSYLMKVEPKGYWEEQTLVKEILATDYLLNLKQKI